jgi:hypothetical protein
MWICYHGTNEENAASILKTGFRYGSWFAASLQDALAFGGPHVFLVAFDFDEPPRNWQFMHDGEIAVDRIVEYSIFDKKTVYDNQPLRHTILEANLSKMGKTL